MMTNLTWSALIFAALAALACWNPEDRPGCDAGRPIRGPVVCCEVHKAACKATSASPAEFEAARRAGGGPAERP